MPRIAKKTEAKPAKAAAKKSKPAAAPAKKTAAAVKSALKLVAKPAAARTRVAKATPGRVVTRRSGGKSEVIGLIGGTVTVEEIALKAYYIAERRSRLGLPGDSQSDWLQAERELRR